MLNYKYKTNSDDIFLRSLYASISEELTNLISYIQIESDTVKNKISVPVFMGATGQERFLQYYFNDKNYVACEKIVEGSFDVIPRGMIQISNLNINTANNTSPFGLGEVFEIDENGYIKTFWSNITGIPLTGSFNFEILTNSHGEQMKIFQNLIKSLYWKRKFTFMFEGALIPTIVSFPSNIEKNKNFEFKNGAEKDRMILRLGLDIETYLPILTNKKFKGERIDKFLVDYDTDSDSIVDYTQTVQHTGSISGRILIEDESYGVIDSITLTNINDDTFTRTVALNDGYFLFEEVPSRIGYTLKLQDGTVLHKKINVLPKTNLKLDSEIFLD